MFPAIPTPTSVQLKPAPLESQGVSFTANAGLPPTANPAPDAPTDESVSELKERWFVHWLADAETGVLSTPPAWTSLFELVRGI